MVTLGPSRHQLDTGDYLIHDDDCLHAQYLSMERQSLVQPGPNDGMEENAIAAFFRRYTVLDIGKFVGWRFLQFS